MRREAELARLTEELQRRARGGHVWLLEGRKPEAVYQLVAAGGQIVVARVDAARIASLAPRLDGGVLLSESQFAAVLRRESIATVAQPDEGPSPQGLLGAGSVGAGLSATPWARGAAGQIARPFSNAQHLRTGLVGGLGEVSMATRTLVGGYGLLPIVDLNAVYGASSPVFDLHSRIASQLISVKASAQAAQAGRVNYNMSKGGPDVTLSGPASRQTLFGRAATTIFPGGPPGAAQASALERARVAVNPEDVTETARRLGGRLAADPARFTAEINGQLGRNPAQLEPGGMRFTTLAALEAEVAAKPHLRPAFQALTSRWAAGAGAKVISHGTPGADLERLSEFRQQIGYTVTEPQIKRAVSPEYVHAVASGGGARGTIASLGQPAAYGAGFGGLIAFVFGGYVYVVDRKGDLYDVLEQSSLGTATGALGGATEQLVTSASNRALVGGLGGLPGIAGGRAGGAALASKGIGGGVAGAIVAPVFVMSHMAYEEYTGQATYAPSKYVSKGTRAGVAGAISGGAGAAASLGTTLLISGAAGSAAGPIGTVVGVIVGFGIYYLVDRAVGDEIESGIDRLAGPSR